MSTFDPNAGGVISLSDATKFTASYRAKFPTATKAHYFGASSIINSILAQTGCVGIRIYYAIDDTNAKQLILTGVDSSGNDMFNGILGDMSSPCPTICDTGSSPLK